MTHTITKAITNIKPTASGQQMISKRGRGEVEAGAATGCPPPWAIGEGSRVFVGVGRSVSVGVWVRVAVWVGVEVGKPPASASAECTTPRASPSVAINHALLSKTSAAKRGFSRGTDWGMRHLLFIILPLFA
jgi:hypothetical protein